MKIDVKYVPTYYEIDVEQQGVPIDYDFDCDGYGGCRLCTEPERDEDPQVELRQRITWRQL
jgi:hypothetical protein